MYKILTISLIALFLTQGSAEAKIPISFGDADRIVKIQDVELKGVDGESLMLGKLLSSYHFLGGITLEDKGYVLALKDDKMTYYPLPTGDELKDLQDQGLLPKELPTYELSFDDYLFGYGLYMFLALMLVLFLGQMGWARLTGKRDED